MNIAKDNYLHYFKKS